MERSRDTGQSSRAEGARHVDDPIRRQAGSHSTQQFERTFKTDIDIFEPNEWVPYQRDIMESVDIKKGFTVTSSDPIGKGLYDNIIDVDSGKIIGINNYKNHTDSWHLSQVIYNQIILVMKKAKKTFQNLISRVGMAIVSVMMKREP